LGFLYLTEFLKVSHKLIVSQLVIQAAYKYLVLGPSRLLKPNRLRFLSLSVVEWRWLAGIGTTPLLVVLSNRLVRLL